MENLLRLAARLGPDERPAPHRAFRFTNARTKMPLDRFDSLPIPEVRAVIKVVK